MKNLTQFILEADEWNSNSPAHLKAWNKFVKFYDECLKHMNKEEILDMLQRGIKDIEDDNLGTYRV